MACAQKDHLAPFLKFHRVHVNNNRFGFVVICCLLTRCQVYQFVTSSKIKMEVQVSNPQGLWLYLSDANSIIKQLEEKEKIGNCKCESWRKGKRKR